MPSIEAPTHYERSKGIMPGRFDGFFKWLDPDFYVDNTGHVEAPVGFVALIEVTDKDIVNWYESQGMSLEEMRDHLSLEDYPLDAGWYVTRTDDNGLIWAMTYGQGALAEEQARADFTDAVALFDIWFSADDNEIGVDIDLDALVKQNETNTEDDAPSYRGVWIDLDSGTWGTSKIVFVDPRDTPAFDLFALGDWLESQPDSEIIKIGRAFGVPMIPSKKEK